MTSKTSIGDRELELLRWVEARGGATVGEAAEEYGAEHRLARSTVLTMMERLRKKRLLRRRSVAGIYRYAVAVPARELTRAAVADFVEATLGGSVAPFVAYLAEREALEESQLDELELLVARLRERRSGGGS